MFGKKPFPEEDGQTPPSSGAAALPVKANIQAVTSAQQTQPALTTLLPKGKLESKEYELLHYVDAKLETADFKKAKKELIDRLMDKADLTAFEKLEVEMKKKKLREATDKLLPEIMVPLTSHQILKLKDQVIDELLAYGPLEPLLLDPDVADILVNTAQQIYVEKHGKIHLTDVEFDSEAHLLGVIQRIVSRVGRRVDESSPMVDARLPDGSRFNAIIPPLALDGCLVSIRKFKKYKMPLSNYVDIGSMSQQMCHFLEICANIRMNIMVSGGTGSGKTTLLNALSGHIHEGERVITIEDAAELQMHQPHVLRMETRPASLEGKGEVTQRQLVRNALRMRPDRIILGEIRGDEIIDLLSAMNTGHDGSMGTIHANSPKDCLARIENLVSMSTVAISSSSLRAQISSALQLVVQIERMRDGKRRIVAIEEILDVVGENITTQTIFAYKPRGVNTKGELEGDFVYTGVKPRLLDRAVYYGRDREISECLGQAS